MLVHRRLVLSAALALGLLWTGVVLAEPLQPLHFHESTNPEGKIYSSTRGGLLIDAFNRPESLESLFVRLPASIEDSRLCLNLVTRDGGYRARMEFDLVEVSQEFVELAYPTRFQRELLEPIQPYLAALASLGEDCAAADRLYVPIAWRRPEVVRELHVLINAGNIGARVLVPTQDGERRVFPCEIIPDHPSIAFEQVCKIHISSELDLLGTEIERDSGMMPLPPIPLPIAF